MKQFLCPSRILICLLLVPLFNSCEKKADEFSNSEPVKYYLSYGNMLSETAGPDGSWTSIQNILQPSGTSCEWNVHLTHNITKDAFGYDLLFWTASPARVRIDFILMKGTVATVLATKELDIEYINETTGIQHLAEIETDPLKGINPKSGKDQKLIFRITQISGTAEVEVYFDGIIGSIGCRSISVYEDM
jgi:hypothetical protein